MIFFERHKCEGRNNFTKVILYNNVIFGSIEEFNIRLSVFDDAIYKLYNADG